MKIEKNIFPRQDFTLLFILGNESTRKNNRAKAVDGRILMLWCIS